MGIFDFLKKNKQTSPPALSVPVQEPAPIVQKERKVFSFDEAIELYVNTGHSSCNSKYEYKYYFSDAFETILNSIPKFEIELSSDKVKRQNAINNPINDYKNITKSSNYGKLCNFVALDTETTGLKTGGNDIIEIAAIRFENYRPVAKFHTYLKPRKAIPADASAVNGITDDMVENAPTFSQIKPALQAFISDLPIVAHNAPFDIRFLYVSGLDLEKHNGKVYDTLQLAKNKVRDCCGDKLDDYKLETICNELNIGCENYHTADADALACGLLFVDILKIIKEVDSVDSL